MAKSDYWQERFIKEEERRNKDARAYLSSIEKQYDKALRNIEKDINNWYSRLAKNNDISLREAKMLLSKNELEEFKWTVQEYIEKGQENAISKEWMKQLENASAKVHISKLEALKVQIQNEIEGLYGERLKGMEDYLERVYGDTYYKSAFIIQKGIGIGWSLSVLDTNKVNQIIHKPWAIDGKNFSERIWEDKAKLINTLHTGLTQNIIRGSAPDDLIRQISKEFGVKKSAAGRLVMTESAAYSSKAQEQCFKDLDVEKYEIIATLDTSTSAICREMDGKVFPMKDYLVGVTANPFHPNCRTCTAPYFEDDVTSMRAMRTEDGKTEYVPANMKYEEWYKKYVMKETVKNDIIKDNIEWRGLKNISERYKKSESIERLKSYYGIEFEESKKYPIDEKLMSNCITWLDSFDENYSEFMRINPCKIPVISVKAPSKMKQAIGYYSYYPKNNKVVELALNGKYHSNLVEFEELIQKCVKHNWYPKNSKIYKTFIHEFGHHVSNSLKNITGIDNWQEIFINDCIEEFNNKFNKNIKSFNDMGIYVSDYGASKIEELFAETFAEYFGGENPREFAVIFGRKLDKILKEVK